MPSTSDPALKVVPSGTVDMSMTMFDNVSEPSVSVKPVVISDRVLGACGGTFAAACQNIRRRNVSISETEILDVIGLVGPITVRDGVDNGE